MADLEKLEQQMMDLQSQLAFAEDTVATLNEAVASQQQEIMTLRQQLALLKQRQDEQAAQLEHGGAPPGASLEEEKPPHY